MKKALTVLVSMFVVFSLAWITNAAEDGKKIRLAGGGVKFFDIKEKIVTVMADGKPDFTFSFNDKTVVRSNTGKTITMSDIKTGDIIVLIYAEIDGKNVAKTVTVASPVASPPAPDKKD